MPKNERYIVGLDIGTTKICCVIAEMRDSGSVDVVGLGAAPSRGLRKGVVSNIEWTVRSIAGAGRTSWPNAGTCGPATSAAVYPDGRHRGWPYPVVQQPRGRRDLREGPDGISRGPATGDGCRARVQRL